MVAFAYLVPFITCLILKFGFQFGGEWKYYFWIIFIGEAVVAGLHYIFYYSATRSEEYIGSLVQRIQYEEPWTELQSRTVTRSDRNGKTYSTTEIRHVYHPERYHFVTSIGSTINTNGRFYHYVLMQWEVKPFPLSWAGSNIKGGIRYGYAAVMPFTLGVKFDDQRWVSVTEKHSYVNKIKNSNSIFKHRKIDRKDAFELGLYDYPRIGLFHDAECLLSNTYPVDEDIRSLFRRFNGKYGAQLQMRLYILVFPTSKGVGITELQKTYWKGGHKNEFVICLGISSSGKVEWARAFSWTDNQQLEVETANWFLKNPDLNWHVFYQWFVSHSGNWHRKEFSDFKYINVSFPLWQILTIYGVSILENLIALKVVLS